MMRGENIPVDLVIQILLRLPAKSIAKFRCVSKLWHTMLLSPYFTHLFHTMSLARPPRLLFVVRWSEGLCFLTSPHPQNPDDMPSSPAAEFLMKFPGPDMWEQFNGNASGFILFHQHYDGTIIICNPRTGQYMSLPSPEPGLEIRKSFLGFDPIDKQFKVLSFAKDKKYSEYLMILEIGNNSWRNVHCPFIHYACSEAGEGTCINGILYYLADNEDFQKLMIVCFDVKSEKFKTLSRGFSASSSSTKLINYKGKLGAVTWVITCDEYYNDYLCLRMWVANDVENPESEWSEHFSISLWNDEVFDTNTYCVVGVTSTGQIVLSPHFMDALKPFYVVYVNPETNTVQKVEIKGLLPRNCFDNGGKVEVYVNVFADYAEDLNLITMMKTTSSSISPPELNSKAATTSTSSKAQVKQDHCTLENMNKMSIR